MKHAAKVPTWPTSMPQGWISTTKPTRHGDQLTTMIARNRPTGLYYSYFIKLIFKRGEGDFGPMDLPAYIAKHPQLDQHRVHLHRREDGWVIDLSPVFGVPTLKDAVLQTALWAEGIGDILRGQPFTPSEP